MGNTVDKFKYAILNSRETLIKNGYTNYENIDALLGQSISTLYNDGSATGFSKDGADALEGISKSEILQFLVDTYVEGIENTEDANIRDDFQNIIKSKIKSEGKDIAKDILVGYIENGDTSKFDESTKGDVVKYLPASLIQSMGIIAAKNILGSTLSAPSVEFEKKNKNRFSALELGIVAEAQLPIQDITAAMEGIRSGTLYPNRTVQEK